MMMVCENTIKIYINFLLKNFSAFLSDVLRLIRSGIGGEEATFKLPKHFPFFFAPSRQRKQATRSETENFYVAVGKCGLRFIGAF